MNLQEQLRALVHRHHANFAEQIGAVDRLLTCGDGHVPAARIVEAEDLTHQMKGTAGSMGFADVGAAAAALDDSLKELKSRGGAVEAGQMRDALDLLARLRRISDATRPEMSTLYDADLSQFTR